MSANESAVKKAALVRAIPIVLILGLGWQFVVSPRISEPERVKAEIVSVESQTAILQEQAGNPNVVEADYQQAVSSSDVLSTRYPADVLAAGINDAIRRAATEAGLSVADIRPTTPGEPVVGGEGLTGETGTENPSEADSGTLEYADVALVVELTATLPQIKDFLEALPRQKRGLIVNSVTTTAIEGGLFSASIECTSLLLNSVPRPNSLG